MADTVRVAVVTEAGGAHLGQYFSSLAEIEEAAPVAVCDPSGDCEAEARKTLGAKLAGFYRDEAALFREFKPQLAVTTLEPRHTPAAIDRCLDAGCHVLSEKPGCTAAEQFAPLVKKADAKHLHLMLALANRPYKMVQEARRIVRRGLLGPLYGVNLFIVADQARLERADYHRSWQASKERAGGGFLAWLGIHWLDLILHITGLKVEQVAGFTDVVGRQPIDTEDSIAAALRFNDRVLGSIQAGYYLDAKHKQHVAGYQSHMQLWGKHGWLRMALFEQEPLQWYSSQEAGPPQVQRTEIAKEVRSYTPFVRQAVRAAGGMQEPPITGTESLHVLRTIFAIYEAAATGRTQTIG